MQAELQNVAPVTAAVAIEAQADLHACGWQASTTRVSGNNLMVEIDLVAAADAAAAARRLRPNGTVVQPLVAGDV